MLVMGLVLGPSLMFISIMGIICKSISPLYCITGVHCLHVIYIVYKHFDRSLQIGLSDPTCEQNSDLYLIRFLGFKLKNKNNKKKFRYKYIFNLSYHPVVSRK